MAVQHQQDHIQSLGEKLKDEVAMVQTKLATVSFQDKAGCARLLKAASKIYKMIIRNQQDEKTKGFRKWVETALQRGVKAARRFTSSDDRPDFTSLLQEDSATGP
eukprot:16442330-Heterocapsa_arctica.AAC.1